MNVLFRDLFGKDARRLFLCPLSAKSECCIGLGSRTRSRIKASLTFKCMTEHLFADFSYSIALDTYL